MTQAKACDYQLDADATKNEIPDQVRNDKQGQCHPERHTLLSLFPVLIHTPGSRVPLGRV